MSNNDNSHDMMMMEEGFNYSDVEDDDDEMGDEEEHPRHAHNQHHSDSVVLDALVQRYDWAAVLGRINTHPAECHAECMEGRTPLHVACDHDAPAVVIQALLQANPGASVLTGTSNMNPLHITCSSQHASVHVVRVLLESGKFEQFSMRDVDGDTPLHAACRCGAPIDVLEVLLRANPAAVAVRDYEGLTPLLRLWVRYFVILGDDIIESVHGAADLQGELLDAWNKTELLLRCAHHGSLTNNHHHQQQVQRRFLALHAASAVDCPRLIVKIAARVHVQQLDERDEEGRTPLMIACAAPVFAVRDLSDEGYTLEDMIHGDHHAENDAAGATLGDHDASNSTNSTSSSEHHHASVIDILLQANHAFAAARGASLTDPSGRLPLHMALEAGKSWNQGVGGLVEAFPESVSIADRSSKLFPYQLAGTKDALDGTFELLRRNPTLLERDAARRKTAPPAVEGGGAATGDKAKSP